MTPAPPSRPATAHRSTRWLFAAALTTLAVFAGLRAGALQPWSQDEYYHLAISRQMAAEGPRLTTLPQTPFSVQGTSFVDKEPLFHLLLLPIAGQPLERAGLLAAMLGQVFLVSAFAFVLWRLRIPAAPWLLLALPALGPLFVLRVEMARPHVWLIGLVLLYLGLLASAARPWTLALSAALGGLVHTGGWIVIGIAGLWVVAGAVASRCQGRDHVVAWTPLPWTAGGWLVGQLLHPNLPGNFGLLWLVNAVIPYQATAGSAALRSQLGNELTPPDVTALLAQWPAFLAPLAVVALVLLVPRLRARIAIQETLTSSVLAVAFLVFGSLVMRRFLELGAPLALLALGLLLRGEPAVGSVEDGSASRPPSWPFAVAVILGLSWTLAGLRTLDYGASAPPRAASAWLASNAKPNDLVFTAQWADSAPLLYLAPGLRSLVALDPTFFLAHDATRFEEFVRIVQGRSADPAQLMRDHFGASWVLIWQRPAYRRLTAQLADAATLQYRDADYLVFELPPPFQPRAGNALSP